MKRAVIEFKCYYVRTLRISEYNESYNNFYKIVVGAIYHLSSKRPETSSTTLFYNICLHYFKQRIFALFPLGSRVKLRCVSSCR